MRSVDKTAERFIESVKQALPGVSVTCDRYKSEWGYSKYIFIQTKPHRTKVRISDHPIGMRRAREDDCQLYMMGGAKPDSWAVWLSDLARKYAIDTNLNIELPFSDDFHTKGVSL